MRCLAHCYGTPATEVGSGRVSAGELQYEWVRKDESAEAIVWRERVKGRKDGGNRRSVLNGMLLRVTGHLGHDFPCYNDAVEPVE